MVFVFGIFVLYAALFLFIKNTCSGLTYDKWTIGVAKWKFRSVCEWGAFYEGGRSFPRLTPNDDIR